MKKRLFTMLSMLFLGILLSGALNAQGIRVTGKVTDAADGSALVGVTVQEKGTTNGTITDGSGTYAITVSPTATLVLSYVGFATQEVAVNSKTSVNVSLSVSSLNLQEVVVIGYGTVARKDATGSIAAVAEREFNKGSVSSPQALITGKVPGVVITNAGGDPSAASTIRIRGGSSMKASNDPLIVIDGVPIDNNGVSGMPNSLNLLNSNDIESFTVLKDASATAIYGSRASNGVILITTKKGSLSKQLKVTYDGSFSFGTKTGQIDVLNTLEYIKLVINHFGGTSAAAKLLTHDDTNWQDKIYQTAISHDQNLSVAGSFKMIPFRASVGYTNQTGLLKTSGLERITGALNLNPSFLDNHLTVTVNSKFMHINNKFADWGSIGSAMQFDPTKPVYNTTGLWGGYWNWTDASGSPMAAIAPRNPVSQLYMNDNTSGVDRILGNVQIDYKAHFLEGLKATLNLGGDFSKSKGKTFVPETAWWSYDAVYGGGYKQYYDQNKKNELLDFYLNYKKDLPSVNSRIDATAGYEWQYFYRNDSSYSSNVAGTHNIQAPLHNATESYLVSFFGRVNYVYADKYMLTATFRADGSSRFATGNKWGMFPSVAMAWDMKQEEFLKNSNVVSSMKLRLGYGITGQQDITGISNQDYPYLPIYVFGQSTAQYQLGNTFVTTIRPSGYDLKLKWEQTTTYNVGIDFGLLKDKITGSIDVYDRPTKDLLNVIAPAAGTNLTNQILTNVGNLVNKGVELGLNYRAVQSQDIDWTIGFNATFNHNEITKLTSSNDPSYAGVTTVGGIAGGVGNYIQINSVGHASRTFYVYEQVYDAAGKPIEGLYVDKNGDGKFSDLDKYRAGSPDAKILAGISSTFRYKNLDFSFNGRLSLGNVVYNNMASNHGSYSEIYSSVGVLNNINRSILKTNFLNPQYWSDYYLEDGSFFKMDNMTIGYNVKNLINEKSNLRIYGSVQNLFTITRYTGLDPEIYGGIDNNVYPRPRTFMLGVNLEF